MAEKWNTETFVQVRNGRVTLPPHPTNKGVSQTARTSRPDGWYLLCWVARPEDEYAAIFFKREYGIPDSKILFASKRFGRVEVY